MSFNFAKLPHLAGRRLRPWWGKSPVRLGIRSIIQIVIIGALLVVTRRVAGGEIDGLDEALGDSADRIGPVTTIITVVGLLWIAWSLVKVVVCAIDLVSRTTTEGEVVSVRRRAFGDVLPRIVQQQIWSRGDRMDTRGTRHQLTLHTDEGPQTWILPVRHHSVAQPGVTVRLTTTPLLGHVRSITRI